MKKIFIALMFIAATIPVHASVQEFIGPDGATPVKVSAANPLPMTGSTGTGTDVASSAVTGLVTGWSSTTKYALAANGTKSLTDICSATATPFTLIIQNTGATKLFHNTSDAGSPFTAPGDVMVLYFKTAVPAGTFCASEAASMTAEILK